ncbi:hypothetical protein [Dokdonia sp. Hel_I_53]|uniref:hypothetical protein n=1 Tax=Dokdonia sp. Hel_I_53 TaxID=1566287 RepID=UPI00119A5901|nr:hypothetical protein [Dokdonia sp. Hel_I_53]TVZ50895.1 hypothetical protein OD90_0026 [Dokdonia sp. Hel_I_53]
MEKEKESIDLLFKRLNRKLDVYEPSESHRANFLEKLEGKNRFSPSKKENRIRWMRPLFIAASLVLIASLVLNFTQVGSATKDLADVSPEMQQTQDFFTKTIERELFDIKENMTPENQELVLDAISQLEMLESEYKKLKKDLSKSGEDKRVIYAMIDNFQNRIYLLQDVVEQMEVIKQIKKTQEAITL